MLPEKIKITPKLIKLLFIETLKGKSILRILSNYSLSNITINGKIIELGSGSDDTILPTFLRFNQPYDIKYTDLYKQGKNVIKLDVEKKFNIKDKTYNTVLCFNLLEHVLNYNNVIAESYRILEKGGYFIGSTPFIYYFHPDPNDYFRYSHQALKKIFESSGFKTEKIIYLGYGQFMILYSNLMGLVPKIFRPLFLFICLFFDLSLDLLRKNSFKHALGYSYIFKK